MVVKILEKELKSRVYNINGVITTSWDIYNQMLPFKNTVNDRIPTLGYSEIYDLLKNFARHLYIERGVQQGRTIYVVYLNMNLLYPDRNFYYKPVAYTDNTKDLMEYLHNIWCVPLHKNTKKPETLKEVNKWIKEAGGGFKIKVEGVGLGQGQYVLINDYIKEQQYFEAYCIDEIVNKVLATYPYILKTWID